MEKSSLQKSLQMVKTQNINLSGDLHQFLHLLNKPFQIRNKKDINSCQDFIFLNKGLAQLIQQASFKFVKNLILRCARSEKFYAGEIIAQEGDKIEKIYVVLSGLVKTNKRLKGQDNSSLKFEKLTQIVLNHSKQANKTKLNSTRGHKVNTLENSKYDVQNDKQAKKFIDEQTFELNTIGIQQRSRGTKFNRDIIAIQTSYMFVVDLTSFQRAFLQFINQKVKYLYDLIHQFPCFLGFDKQIIERFIIALIEKRQKRGSYIYKQNEEVANLYLLSSGQIKFTKETVLFVEDPNNLYANRLSLMLETKEQKSKHRYLAKQQQAKRIQASLPYADLSQMYHFSPKKKVVEISHMQPFCFFGGEQLFENKPRQTNAICNSLEVIFYQISMSKLKQIFGNRNLNNFIKGLRLEAKDKMLIRQENLAQTIQLENQNNLNYFYYDGEKEQKLNYNFRISKLNKRIDENNGVRAATRTPNLRHEIPPQYTAFNFNKIPSTSHAKTLTAPKLKQYRSQKLNNPESKYEQTQSDDDLPNVTKPNKQELKIVNISHTWKFIQKKVQEELAKSQKLSPYKCTIDVNSPLIDNKFLTELDRDKRKLQRKIRKEKITLNKLKTNQILKKTGKI